MLNKNVLGMLFGFVLFLLVPPLYVHADGDTVKDMYENSNKEAEQKGNVSPEDNDSLLPTEEVEQNLSEDKNLNSSSLVFNLIQMVFALFLILALIYLLLKFLNKRNKIFNKVRALENLGGIAVGPSKSIQIVRVGNKLYLIGVGENVQLLEELEDEDLKEEIIKSYQEQPEFKPENIFSIFQRKSNQEDSESGVDFKNLFSNELEKLKQNRKNLMNKHTEKEDKHE